MPRPLRLLILEDRPDDAELLVGELQRHGFSPDWTRVDTLAAFVEGLAATPDVVLSDFHLPDLTALDALNEYRHSGLLAPFIVVTGAVDEETAAECIKQGAWDYLLKDRLARLGPAVEQALERARMRREQEEREEDLRAAQEELAAIFESSPVPTMIVDPDFRLVRASRSSLELARLNTADAFAVNIGTALGCVHAHEPPVGCGATPKCSECALCRLLATAFEEGISRRDADVELTLGRDGKLHQTFFLASVDQLPVGNRGLVILSLHDITARRTAERRVQRLNRLLDTIREVTRLIVRERSRSRLLAETCRIAVEQGRFAAAWVDFAEPSTGELTPVAMAGNDAGYLVALTHSAGASPAGLNPSRGAVGEGRTVVVNDLKTAGSSPWASAAVERGFRSLVALPLVVGGTHAGSLSVVAADPDVFDAEIVGLLEELAADLGFALAARDTEEKRAVAVEAERRRSLQLVTVNRVGAELAVRLDLRDLLTSAAREIRSTFGYFNVTLLLLDPDGGELRQQAMAGAPAHRARPAYRARVGVGVIGLAAQSGQTVVVNDTANDPRYLEGFTEDAVTRSEIAVPVKLGDQVIGVLDVQETRPRAFDDTDVLTLETLARIVAAAIQNARLFATVQSELGERSRAEEDYRQLFEAESDAIFLVDNEEGRILTANTAAVALYGYSREALLTMRNSDLSAEPEETRKDTTSTPAHDDRVVSVPLRLHRRRDGTVFPVEITGRFFVRNGRPVHIAAIRDISGRHRLEKQLLHAQKIEAVGRLAGGVAHDFNNLLQVMLGLVGVIRSETDSVAARDALLAELEEHAMRGAQLTRQLLLFSRQETARRESLDLNQVVEGLARMLHRLLRETVTLALDLDPAPLQVSADRGQLEQVLMNLVVNASEAMPEGGQVTIRTRREGSQVCLEASDTGCGISPEDLPLVFDPFFTTKEHGTGLGLSVAHGVVTGAGGTVEVASQPGRGTTFVIRLPWSEAGFRQRQDYPAASAAPTPGRGERVLVVEDDPGVRLAVDKLLSSYGYRVLTVESAREARDLPPTEELDVLLCDHGLPDASGYDLLVELGRRWPQAVTILMSGYAQDHARGNHVATVGLRFLAKPFSAAELGREVHEALASRPTVGPRPPTTSP